LRAVPILHAIVLGLVQGLSEFLPISSSGHLLLVPWLFGWHDFDNTSIEKAFDVALHLGTLVAVVGYFWRELVTYVREGVRLVVRRERPANAEGRLAWLLVLSSLPAAAAGALFEKTIDNKLGKPGLIAVSLIVFGVLLAVADRRAGQRTLVDYQADDAVKVGLAQVLALNPGTSRSGITMTAARFLGFTRDTAARVSFLMAIPVTAGAVAYKMLKLAKDGVPPGLGGAMVVGIITAAVAGWAAVWGTLRLIRTRSFMPFVIYRCALGVVVLVVLAAGWR
jgi:undecaprenyl-diphosphatase